MTSWLYFAYGLLTGIMILLAHLIYMRVKRKKRFMDESNLYKLLERSWDIIYYYELKPKYKHRYTTPSVDYFLGEGTLDMLNSNSGTPFIMIHPDDADIMHKKVTGELDYSKGIIQRLCGTNETYRWFEEFTTPIYKNGEIVAVQGVMRNIDEKVKLEQELNYQITHDALTNLYNRGYFEGTMKMYDKDVDTSISILLCDLDELKYVNDNFGHAQGDQRICEAANFLISYFSPETVVARIGGDEFAIIQSNHGNAQIEGLYEGLFVALDDYNANHDLSLYMSVGYAHSEHSLNKMELLFSEADQKMYEQKKAKKQIPVLS